MQNIIALSLILNGLVGFQNPNDVSEFYTSGLDDKTVRQTYYNNTAFAVLSIPFNFMYNQFNKQLIAGYYELQPIYQNEEPVFINFRQLGKVVGSVSVIDFKEIHYVRSKPTADISFVDNGRKAMITLKNQNLEIYGIIDIVNRVP